MKYSRCYNPTEIIKRARLRWRNCLNLATVQWDGSQATHAYSSFGRTRVRYKNNFSRCRASEKLRQKGSSIGYSLRSQFVCSVTAIRNINTDIYLWSHTLQSYSKLFVYSKVVEVSVFLANALYLRIIILSFINHLLHHSGTLFKWDLKTRLPLWLFILRQTTQSLLLSVSYKTCAEGTAL